MVKKPAFDYSALNLTSPPSQAASRRLDAIKGQPYVTYLHPAGHRALKQYALDANTSVQRILIEALEDWAKKHGIAEMIRPERTK